MSLAFPEIEEAVASSAAVVLVEPAAAAIDLSKINITDIALAQFGQAERDLEAAEKALKNVQHDLSTPKKLSDAISLRQRLVNQPRADARKVSKALKSKLTSVAGEVTAREGEIIADFARIEAYITPQIDAREEEIEREKERDEARKADHVANIAKIAALLHGAENKSAERLAKGIEIVDGLLVTGFEEFQPEAEATRTRVLLALKTLHQKAVDREAEAARIAQVAAEQAEAARVLAEERAQLARERAELEALRAAQVPAPVPSAPASEPAPAPVEPVVQDPLRVFDRQEVQEQPETAGAAGAAAPASQISPQIVQDYRFGLPLDSGEFVPASQLNAHPAAPATRRTLDDADLLAIAHLFVTDFMDARGPGEHFPSHPKPSREWWDGMFDRGEKLLAQIGGAA